MKALHQRLVLYTDGRNAYTFEPADTPGARPLTIHRTSGEIVLEQPNTRVPPRAVDTGRSLYGIMGILSLSLSDYVIVITSRVLEGNLMGHEVYRATDFDILPISNDVSVNQPPNLVESHLLGLLRFHLKGGNFLFSYTWDLTRRLQAQWIAQESDNFRAMWEKADERFFWNKFVQARFIDITMRDEKQDLSPFIIPVMYGTFDIRSTGVNGHRMKLCLISRRSRHRAGTRYFRRGVDGEGHVANFNETEQIVLIGDYQSSADEFATKLSYVQIRGSIPIFWAEINTLRYKPDLQIMGLEATGDALRRHIQEQTTTYGTTHIVSLVNIRGHEMPLKEAYERYLSEVPEVEYTHFDFHKECKDMRWTGIRILLDQIDDSLNAHGYFHIHSAHPTPVKLQNGVIRTNCLDNLDRTNIAQTAIAKLVLTRQLQAMSMISSDKGVDDFEELSKTFRELWADLGDSIAKAYSGSGAMKADFTRTNKRTEAGKWEDGYKGALRYIKNNFFDGARQDAFDLFTGAWTPRQNPSSAHSLITDTRPLITRSIPYVAWYSLFMIFAGLTLPRTSDYSLFYYFVLWFALFTLAILYIFIHGMDYVSWPKLIPLDSILYYEGPGHRYGKRGKGFRSHAPKSNGYLPISQKVASAHALGVAYEKRID